MESYYTGTPAGSRVKHACKVHVEGSTDGSIISSTHSPSFLPYPLSSLSFPPHHQRLMEVALTQPLASSNLRQRCCVGCGSVSVQTYVHNYQVSVNTAKYMCTCVCGLLGSIWCIRQRPDSAAWGDVSMKVYLEPYTCTVHVHHQFLCKCTCVCFSYMYVYMYVQCTYMKTTP